LSILWTFRSRPYLNKTVGQKRANIYESRSITEVQDFLFFSSLFHMT
jgi:hypothetical protein